jgi:hypothetical protein
MKQHLSSKKTARQQRNMQYSEDRFELIDTIRELVNDELELVNDIPEHGNGISAGTPDCKNPPCEKTGHEPPAPRRPHRTFRQWLMGIFSNHLLS